MNTLRARRKPLYLKTANLLILMNIALTIKAGSAFDLYCAGQSRPRLSISRPISILIYYPMRFLGMYQIHNILLHNNLFLSMLNYISIVAQTFRRT